MKLKLVLWAIKHHRLAFGLHKVIKGLEIKDGTFLYSTGKMWNPADTTFTNNIVADHKVIITHDDGGVNISGYVGGLKKAP